MAKQHQINTRVPSDLRDEILEYQNENPQVDSKSAAARDLLAAGAEHVQEDTSADDHYQGELFAEYLHRLAATVTAITLVAIPLLLALPSPNIWSLAVLVVLAIVTNAVAYTTIPRGEQDA